MKYDYRYISTERCQEINNMKIPSPFVYGDPKETYKTKVFI